LRLFASQQPKQFNLGTLKGRLGQKAPVFGQNSLIFNPSSTFSLNQNVMKKKE